MILNFIKKSRGPRRAKRNCKDDEAENMPY